LELLRELVPRATTIIAMLVNPNTPVTEAERRDVQAAAQTIGQQLVIFDVSSERDIESAFGTFVQHGAGALLVGSGESESSPCRIAMRCRLVIASARGS
jgi:putative ABC transport system substrate-binding protein